jgi:nitroreductase
MEFRDVLRRRRMVRSYLPDPIDPEIVDRVVEAGWRAPSGGFSQGHAFVVVTDPETRRQIADAMEEQEWIAQGRVPWLSVAPVHIIPCAREALYHERYNKPDKLEQTGGVEVRWPVPYWFVDIGASFMGILLAAVDEGLAAGIAGHPDQEERLRPILGLPESAVPIGVVTLGKEAPDPKRTHVSAFTERRRPKTDVVHHDRWAR